MLVYSILLSLVVYGLFSWSNGMNHDLLGPADVIIKGYEDCPDDAEMKYHVNIARRKINRTHEVYDADTTFDMDLDENYGGYLNIARWGDGGYKPNAYEYNTTDPCEFLMKMANKGFKELLIMAGHEPKCPIKAGSYSIKNYLINYQELPYMLYGDFRVDVYITFGEKKILCKRTYVLSKPKRMF